MQMCAALVQSQVHLVRALSRHNMKSVLHFRLMPYAILEVWPVNQQRSLLIAACSQVLHKYDWDLLVHLLPVNARSPCRCTVVNTLMSYTSCVSM